jgi:diadenylate cyclase
MRNERSFVMEAIINFFKEFAALVPTIRIMDIVDILVVAFVIYKIILMLQTTSSARIAKSIVIILLLTALTSVLHMYLMNYLLDKILEIGLLALVIMFQPELRRILEKLGSKSFREILSTKQEMRNIDYVISETVKACEIMSRERTGVLIVFERTSSLEDYQKTGIVIDARVSSELLRNIFFTKASLHDGAVIIRNERIAAAGCVLPLTENRNISSDLGTRHRAGIGMSEVSDAVVVIVSEETGTISVAISGMLKRHLAPQTLEKLLLNELAPKEETKTRNPLKLLRKQRKEKDDSDAET